MYKPSLATSKKGILTLLPQSYFLDNFEKFDAVKHSILLTLSSNIMKRYPYFMIVHIRPKIYLLISWSDAILITSNFVIQIVLLNKKIQTTRYLKDPDYENNKILIQLGQKNHEILIHVYPTYIINVFSVYTRDNDTYNICKYVHYNNIHV